jgi:hypothetical protein
MAFLSPDEQAAHRPTQIALIFRALKFMAAIYGAWVIGSRFVTRALLPEC